MRVFFNYDRERDAKKLLFVLIGNKQQNITKETMATTTPKVKCNAKATEKTCLTKVKSTRFMPKNINLKSGFLFIKKNIFKRFSNFPFTSSSSFYSFSFGFFQMPQKYMNVKNL